MAFTAADVKNLREMTGVGMMDCKKALTASDGDMDKAVEWLREKGMAASAKKAGRIAAEGMAYAAVIDGVGVVVEVNAETDFVGKNEKFQNFVKGVAAVVAKEDPKDLEALMAAPYGNGRTVEQERQEMVLVIGENIQVRRFARFAANTSTPYILSLIHIPVYPCRRQDRRARQLQGRRRHRRHRDRQGRCHADRGAQSPLLG